MIKQCVDAELLKGACKINMKMCTTSSRATSWNEIDFVSAEKHVKKLQKRISTAMGNGYVDEALRFQHVLIHSFYAKALAVKTVSMNRGKNTCGVDGIVWSSPSAKFDAIDCLHRRGYRHKPLLRVYKCESRKTRALGIPTMQDRAMQTLYKFALEPIAEVLADEHSYAYRKNRSVEDAILHCCDVLEHDLSVEWILKIDIKSCFDMISHEWLMNHIPMDKEILQKILKCGYIDRSRFYPTDRGIPQGGPISSVLCNMTLDGLEPLLVDTFGCDIHFVRYADDILIIEDLVISECRKLLTDDNIKQIAKETVAVYKREKDQSNLNYLKKCLAQNERRHQNAIAGIMESDIESVRKALAEQIPILEKEHRELEKQIAIEEAPFPNVSTAKIRFFLNQLKKGNVCDIKYKKTLINIFVNKIYLWDDRITITYNTWDEHTVVDEKTLAEIEESVENEKNLFFNGSSPPDIKNRVRKDLVFLCLR